MRANSLDLRQRIVQAVQADHTKAQVATMFQVDRRTINHYVRLAQAGQLAPKPIPGRPPHIPPEQEAALIRHLQLQPTATLEEHCQRWERVHGVALSTATMSRAIKRVGWTRKKGQWQPASGMTARGLPGGRSA